VNCYFKNPGGGCDLIICPSHEWRALPFESEQMEQMEGFSSICVTKDYMFIDLGF